MELAVDQSFGDRLSEIQDEYEWKAFNNVGLMLYT